MARRAVGLSVTSTVIGGEGFRGGGGVVDPINTVSTTAVAAAIAVLVADGASPTQAHVTTLNSAWTTLLAGTGGIPAVTDVVLSYDTTAVGSRSVLEAAVRKLLDGVRASNDFAH